MPRSYRYFNTDDYEITRNGDVINKHTGRTVKAQKNDKGYLRVSIGGKLMFVHRLVAKLYVPNPEHKPQVNHIDGNKLNNCAENLEWVTNKENREHAVKNNLHLSRGACPWAKLTEEDVEYIRRSSSTNAKDLANEFNVSISTIKDVRLGRTWKY